MQILKKYKKWNPILQLDRSNIMDFAITNTNSCENNIFFSPSSFIDFGDFRCYEENAVISNSRYVWDKAIVTEEILENIGFTGIDNGLVRFDSGYITNNQFLGVLKTSMHLLSEKKLKLYPIRSNTGIYTTDYKLIEGNESYVKLNGGGFQGFFKTSDNKYQILPSTIDNILSLGFKLRPMNYEEKNNSLNNLHPNNKGFFFYIGTRAENKFLNDYGYDFSKYEIRPNVNYDYCAKVDENYFSDDYILNELPIEKETLSLNNGINLNAEGYFEIETDNKYLFFNKTKDGFDVDTWDNNSKSVLTGITRPNINLYLLLNKTNTGYTVDNINEYFENYKSKTIEQIIKNDIINNAFGLRIKDDGSIGYRYIIEDCNNEFGYNVVEEYSLPNIIVNNEWNDVVVKLKNNGGGKMKIYIYVNKYLKFVSKELPLLDLRKLDEIDSKQEGVPYNISIGCGTMGLADSISWDYNKPFKYILPIEENFCGTFIGDIAEFKLFTEDVNVKDDNLYFTHRFL